MKKIIHNRIFNVICAILFAASLTAFALVLAAFLLGYAGGFWGKSYEETLSIAMDRISTHVMGDLVTDLCLGTYPDRNAVKVFPEEEYEKLEAIWKETAENYGTKKNVNFAVIASTKDRFELLDLSDEDIYLYKSPGYTDYSAYLSGEVFAQRYYSISEPFYMVLAAPDMSYYHSDETYFDEDYYVYVLYKTADNIVENGDDYYDSIYADKDIRSYLYTLHWAVSNGIVPMAAACVIMLLSLVMYCVSAGHRKDREGIYVGDMDRIPLEILLAGYLAVFLFLLLMLNELVRSVSWMERNGVEFAWLVFICCAFSFICSLIGLSLLGTVVVRIKSKTFWKNTFACRIKDKTFKGLSKAGTWVAKHIPLAIRVGIIILALGFISLIEAALIQDASTGIAILFVFGRIAVIAMILYLFWGYAKLRDGAVRIAEGKLDERIDDKLLLPEYRYFAGNLNRVGDSIKIAVDERMKSERLKTQLITNVSHDIKTPLTSIINYVDLMQKDDVSEEEKKEYLEILAKQSAKLKKLIQDLIDASKASAGAVDVELSQIDLCTLTEQVLGEYHDKLEEAKLTVIDKKPEGPVMVSVDSNLLWRVMDNLFVNVLKYAMPGTRVYLEQGRSAGMVTLSISNISNAELGISGDELMERFVRGDRSRGTEGSGLGLSIAGSLMELMGGSIRINVDGDMFKAVLSIKSAS